MNLVDFLKNSEVKNGYSLTLDNIEEDYIYSEEFEELIKTKEIFSFKTENYEEFSNNELLLSLITILINDETKDKIFIEYKYNDKSEDEDILELYKYLNLLSINLIVYPSDSVSEDDYVNLLLTLRNILNGEDITIDILPVSNFENYIQQKIIIEEFVDLENEESKVRAENLLNPEPSEILTNVLFLNKNKEEINKMKDVYFNNIEDKNEIKKNLENLLGMLKNNLEKNSDYYNIYFK